MSWKFVFYNCHKMWLNRDAVCEAAEEAGYNFFTFNGRVFFIIDKNNYKDTGIIEADLF